ncbi:MAG TPA: glycosyltransferase family A protein [Gemmatimonadaceae bacterium]
MSSMPIAVSVIVCTRNRCEKLINTLEAMTRLAIPPELAWELVVVDNGSTDGTADLLARYEPRLPLRHIVELEPGLSSARNAGLRAAHGLIIAFTDDDCIPAAGWLATLHEEFARSTGLAGLGGRVELYDPADYPITIRTSRQREALAFAHQLPALMAGCNMAFRRATFDVVGRFDTALGAGTRVGSAEDTDFLYRALLHGLEIEYIPRVVVQHDHGRRTRDAVRRLRHCYARGRGALLFKYLLRADRGMVACIYADALWNTREIAKDLRARRLPREVWWRCWHMLMGAALWIVTPRSRALSANRRASTQLASVPFTSPVDPS